MKPEFFDILRKIHKDPEASQRALAKELGLSIGKLNYCLKALKEKGFIKIKNFSKSKKKIKYLYFLTPKGALEKTNVTISYMKKKMQEYEELKKELKIKK
jgi:EPS-associated MarR family transcriptional regulator